MLEQINNYKHIATKLHTSAQPDKDQLLQLSQVGIEVVINLAHNESPGAVADENERIKSQGILYINIPVDFNRPLLKDFNQFVEAMNKHSAKTVLVHCAYNWRVSVFVYLYRLLVEHADQQQAEADMLAVWQPDETWREFIAQCQVNYHGRR